MTTESTNLKMPLPDGSDKVTRQGFLDIYNIIDDKVAQKTDITSGTGTLTTHASTHLSGGSDEITALGALSSLTTTSKSNLVSAINEVNSKVGTGSTGGSSGDYVLTSTLTSYGLNGITKSITGTNLNDLKTSGFYSGNSLTNAPNTDYYYVEVIKHNSSYILQRITGITGTNKDKYFQRSYNGSAWAASWSQIPVGSSSSSGGGSSSGISFLHDEILKTDRLPITDGTYHTRKVLYSKSVTNLKPTDTVLLYGTAEITIDNKSIDYWIGIGRQIIAGTSDLDTAGSNIIGSPAQMTNFNINVHHALINAFAIDTGRTG